MDAIELTTTAQLLASEFGVTVELALASSSNDAAYTRKERNNTHTIVLPMATGKYKEEALAWLRGYLDHEVGHVLFTDFELVQDESYRYSHRIREAHSSMEPSLANRISKAAAQVWQCCFNLVEDGRVERLMAARYPGSRSNLRWLSDRLFTAHEFDMLLSNRAKPAWKSNPNSCGSPGKDKDISLGTSAKLVVLTGLMLHAMRWFIYHGDAPFYGDGHPVLEQCATEEELRQARLLAERASRITTQEQASALAGQCADLLLDCLDSPEEYGDSSLMEQMLKRDAGDTSDGMSDDTYEEQNNASSKWAFASSVVNSVCEQGDLADRTFKALAGKPKGGSSAPGGKLVTPADGGHEEAEIMRHLLCEMVSVVACRKKGNADRNKKFQIYDDRMLRGIDTVCSASYQVLSSTLQTATYVPARTGTIGLRPDNRFLVRPSMGDGRIFTRRAERIAIDTNVVLLLDTSGSMANISEMSGGYSVLQMAVQVAHGMARALRMLPHVTSRLYAYSSDLIVELEDRMMLSPRGGTPTAGAINVAYMEAMRTSPKARQVMFVITDGCPDNEEATRYIIERMLARGVDMYGLELISSIQDGVVAMMGPDRSAHVSNMRRFASTLNTLMRKALIRSAA